MKPTSILIASMMTASLGCAGTARGTAPANEPAVPNGKASPAPVRSASPAAPLSPECPADPTATAVKYAAPPGSNPADSGDDSDGTVDTVSSRASLRAPGANGAAVGTIIFSQTDRRVTITGSFFGLPPGKHGLHIRTRGDCGGSRAGRSGSHFNPTNAKHGPPESAQRHVGDLGNVTVNAHGNAIFVLATDSLTVVDGPMSVTGRSIVVTARADDGKSQPDGAAGHAIACGIIRAVAPADR